MSRTAFVGLLVMVISESATLARIEPFWSWNTPIAWTGFILFADGIVWQIRGDSWIRSSPREFAVLSAVSVLLWLIFEGYNLVIRNWYYVGLPENRTLRYFGDIWSFSTIWPAIFEGAELAALLPLIPSARGVTASRTPAIESLWRDLALVLAGLMMLTAPFLVARSTARYLAAPVWLGFILLLDPINRRLGEASLLSDLHAGRYDRLTNLLLSGLLCGILWEFWNYWSRAKWHYTVPIMAQVKIFEMPLPGYLGFPAFALECFTMYTFIRAVARRRGRPIGV